MKIVQVVIGFSLGGAETMCENLLCELKKLGHDVSAISFYSDRTPITQRLEKNGIETRIENKIVNLKYFLAGFTSVQRDKTYITENTKEWI